MSDLVSQEQADERYLALHAWTESVLGHPVSLKAIAGDASFRRYFRVRSGGTRYLVMDAPPPQENCQPFVAIAKAFSSLGVNVPEIHAADIERGFLLLTDFGDSLLLDELSADTVDHWYGRAMDDLLLIQSCQGVPNYPVPQFDEAAYRRELNLFRDWYLLAYRGLDLSKKELGALDAIDGKLIEDALSQPQVCVHLDYHARNLMLLPGDQLGVLDFQDARWGPVTYDLVSLLRDCYIDWPVERVEQWVLAYQQKALNLGLLQESDPEQFLKWFDWIGLQRHLKCLGIFARLKCLYNRPNYLQHIPRVLRYIDRVCERYPEFVTLVSILHR